jgi:hypothetical protein
MEQPALFGPWWAGEAPRWCPHEMDCILRAAHQQRHYSKYQWPWQLPVYFDTFTWLWSFLTPAQRAARATGRLRPLIQAYPSMQQDPAFAAQVDAWLAAEGFPG